MKIQQPTPEVQKWFELAEEWQTTEEVPQDAEHVPGAIIGNLVAEPKKGRLCANPRLLNELTKKMSIRMESLKDVRARFRKGRWLLRVDLAKFYWSLPIYKHHRKYFRFRVNEVLKQWTCLPFGYKNAMQIMQRLLDPVIQKMGSDWGVEVISWVDDLILQLSEDREEAMEQAANCLQLLLMLGFILNTEKTDSEVVKEVPFRGFMWSTEEALVWAPPSKLKDIRETAKQINVRKVSARLIAKLIGKVRYIAQIHTHLLAWIVELEITKANWVNMFGWDTHRSLPQEAVDEVLHWRCRREVLAMPLVPIPELVTMGDAGPLGFAFMGLQEIAGEWSHEEAKQSTNYRELLTWKRQIERYAEDLSSVVSQYGTDSTNALSYIKRVYGKTPSLARMAADTWKLMEEFEIIQIPVLLSQEEISAADKLSRLREKDDYSLPSEEFHRLTERWRITPTIDLFASRFSKKVPRFCSKIPDPHAVATDAFSIDWKTEIVYAFPPQHLIHRTLSVLENLGVSALLITPEIKVARWRPTLKRLETLSVLLPRETVRLPFGCSDQSFRWRASLISGS